MLRHPAVNQKRKKRGMNDLHSSRGGNRFIHFQMKYKILSTLVVAVTVITIIAALTPFAWIPYVWVVNGFIWVTIIIPALMYRMLRRR